MRTRPLDLGVIASRRAMLGGGARLRTRWAVPLAAALVLPGLLYGGYVRLNPLGLPADHVVASRFDRLSVALRLLPGDRPMPIDDTYLGVRVCGDAGCRTDHRYDYSESAVGHGWIGRVDKEETGTAELPDGTVAAAAWFPMPLDPGAGDDKWGLHLLRCGSGGCGGKSAVQDAPLVTRGTGDDFDFASAMTTTRSGVLIATIQPGGKYSAKRTVRLIQCADVRCAEPRAVTVAHLPDPGWPLGLQSRPLALAIGQDGRPIVAYEDGDHGGVAVISCDSFDCRHPRTTWPVPRARAPVSNDLELPRDLDGVHIEVPPDGRPVLAFQDVRTGAARLLRCRTRNCAQADDTALTGPDSWRSRPALTLDRDGRPLVATYDHGGVELIACRDPGCAHRRSRTLAKLKHGPGYLDLALTHDRRPVVLWSDEFPDDGDEGEEKPGQLHLTSCARPRCGLP